MPCEEPDIQGLNACGPLVFIFGLARGQLGYYHRVLGAAILSQELILRRDGNLS